MTFEAALGQDRPDLPREVDPTRSGRPGGPQIEEDRRRNQDPKATHIVRTSDVRIEGRHRAHLTHFRTE